MSRPEQPAQPEQLPVIPPDWYVDRFNSKLPPGVRPAASGLDPRVMALWGIVRAEPPLPLCIVTGI